MNRNPHNPNPLYFDHPTLRHLSYCSILPKILASASHEMLQPINIIKISATGILSRMKKEKKLPPEILKEELEMINGQADRLTRIITQLRSLSKEEPAVSTGSGDLNSAIQRSLEICQQQLKTHGIETILHLQPQLPCVQAQTPSLRFIFLSLISNSLNAFDKLNSEQQKQLQIKTFAENGNIIAQIIDNGCGIEADSEQELFIPFTTSNINRPGLGLFLCSLILEQTGDIIRNTSLKSPTIFQITFQPAVM